MVKRQTLEGTPRLVYPRPEVGRQGASSLASLGTNFTLDLPAQGKIRFDPDIRWIPPSRRRGLGRLATAPRPGRPSSKVPGDAQG